MEAQHAQLAHEHLVLRGVITLMLQEVAVRTQQADKQQREAEGRAQATSHIARSVRWVNNDAPVASEEDTLKLISSTEDQLGGFSNDLLPKDCLLSFLGSTESQLRGFWNDHLPRSDFLSFLSSFVFLPPTSQVIIMRHRRIQKMLACLGDNAIDAAAVRDPDGTWAHFVATHKDIRDDLPDAYA